MIPEHQAMLARLDEAGELPPSWRPAFERVSRHAFLPERIWLHVDGRPEPLDRASDPQRWLAAAYADQPIATQLDDGAGGTGYVTSSASMPSIVARMLHLLDVAPGMRVLEIGTGTGYNAALLAARLGAPQVTTVEVDAVVADRARACLHNVGWPVTVVTADGAYGYAASALYDRVLSTAAVQCVPGTWVAQTAPGGRILTPWGTTFHNGALLNLHVAESGEASGHFAGNVAFMWLRGQRGLRAVVEDLVDPDADVDGETTDLHPHEPIGNFDARFAIGLALPAGTVEVTVFDDDQPGNPCFTVYLLDPESRAWASWRITPHTRRAYPVRQHGSRRLFDELRRAYTWWTGLGRPAHTRFGATVTADGDQRLWIDTPANPVDRIHASG